ncbi:Arginine N-methyltransferase 2 [Venustampulla echinocandica]|uniref:Arginine N-methyltransferase 2 n=1 Tax=Venustampulla echinocandica TaxID=2656787 RepID=A0A370T916_9HELO|nr:Arginine N-methyltransferase 2 [Venustampulla echinocandica]RDL29967.1 Arginine N-methyltransferase 2 [Venustampulla echinocandica]
MDDSAFSTSEVDINTQTILLYASNHDLGSLKPLLRIPGNATVQDPETGYTPLHAAIAACGPTSTSSNAASTVTGDVERSPREGGAVGEADAEAVDIQKAAAVVKEIFISGAIWNDLDANNETPGCLAWRLGRKELYEMCVEAGVRAEILLGLMGKYEALGSDSEEDEEGEEEEAAEETKEIDKGAEANRTINDCDAEKEREKRDVNSEDYLRSTLTFDDDKLLDADRNGIMMAWETDIMRRSVDALLPPPSSPGNRILNIGFGMGIIDRMLASTKPLTHHIIEAHPAVLSKLQSAASDFGPTWESSAPEGGSYKVHAGKWQDILPTLLTDGLVFDAIYFDTFGEDYSALKDFFTEYVPGLLDSEGRFGFFNGLGADRRVCYDVYTRVVECDLADAGLDVEWEAIDVPALGGEGEGEWEGVRRRYWTLDRYQLPVCKFL